MTRRIALAILLTVWGLLVAGGATAYLTVRAALTKELDESLMARALGVPELLRPATRPVDGRTVRPTPTPADEDGIQDYVIEGAVARISPPTGGFVRGKGMLIDSRFVRQGDGSLVRNVTFRATLPDESTYVVSLRGSARRLDRLLDRLLLALIIFGLCAGLLTALVAIKVSRAALKPLHATAAVIGGIDPRNLHRRIEAARLPPELVPMAERLNEMLERIERAYVQRQQFLADASHELRTPVAAIVTTAEVSLRHVRSAESYRSTLESCLADARLLRRLVERLMEQCRADTLSHDETVERTELKPLLEQCADQAAALGHDRNVTVRREIPAGMALPTQPQRLRSIVTNLLSNAVEYNRPGGIVELLAQPNGKVLHLTIRDTGPGIAQEHLPHLFEPFYRADRSRTNEAGHLGLGLSLVQSHVAALGGEIRVESEVGAGTTFTIDLPINNGASAAL
jgi:signal transduction histidine kinase